MLILTKDYSTERLKNIPPKIGHGAAAPSLDRDRPLSLKDRVWNSVVVQSDVDLWYIFVVMIWILLDVLVRQRRRRHRGALAAVRRSYKITVSGRRSMPAVRSATWSWWSLRSLVACGSVAVSIPTSTSAALPTYWHCSMRAARDDLRVWSNCRTPRFTSSRPALRTSLPTLRPATSASTVINMCL